MENLIIKNFKCFENIKIPLNRLTVMTGANGNGKSTAIQGLLLLRKTIEQYYSQNIKENENQNLKISLNQGYMLSLGSSSSIINRFSNRKDFFLGILADFIEDGGLSVDLKTDNTVSELFLEFDRIDERPKNYWPIRDKEFYYLNAERVGPRVRQSIHHYDFPHSGFQGEYVAQLIASLNYTVKIEAERRHSKTKSPWLEAQINAWLNDIMPGVSITAVQDLKTMTAQIMVENFFTKGEPVIATNIGFGISYVLPIIATGLIAKNGSYFIVENPEAHLHPSAQSKIGGFLTMVANSGVNVVIETHSDHVINGIQLAVAKAEISPDMVNINFFDQSENSSQPAVETIEINRLGELSKWPKGFFDQSQSDFAELFKIRKG